MGKADETMYTICFYHGTKKWTGPRRLSDMMDFGEDGEKWRELFCDYPMLLVCADDEGLADRCTTDLKWLLKALAARGDKERMRELAKTEALRHLDPDTSQTIAVMTNMEKFLKNKEAYHNQEEEGDAYNMCQALEELAEEAREEGREEMREEMREAIRTKLIRQVCKNLRKGKTTEQIAEDLDEDIVEIRNICEVAEAFAPAYDAEQVFRKVKEGIAAKRALAR